MNSSLNLIFYTSLVIVLVNLLGVRHIDALKGLCLIDRLLIKLMQVSLKNLMSWLRVFPVEYYLQRQVLLEYPLSL